VPVPVPVPVSVSVRRERENTQERPVCVCVCVCVCEFECVRAARVSGVKMHKGPFIIMDKQKAEEAYATACSNITYVCVYIYICVCIYIYIAGRALRNSGYADSRRGRRRVYRRRNAS
jgi:hypothetical protein